MADVIENLHQSVNSVVKLNLIEILTSCSLDGSYSGFINDSYLLGIDIVSR